jgi:hypothetical protein
MFKASIIACVVIIAGVAMWSLTRHDARVLSTARSLSYAEMHARAHLDSLPIQEFDDQSTGFPVAQR